MRVQEFLRDVTDHVRAALPPGLREFEVIGPMASLVKYHYGDRRVHFEVWVESKRGIVEVGLHFESDADRNAQYLAALSRCFEEIAAALGPDVEPEQWTESWTRVHTTLPLQALEEPFALEVAERMAAFIRTLQPMVSELSSAS